MPVETPQPAAGTVVGREAELSSIAKLLRFPADTRGVLLEGEPGIGKTTLWEEGVRIAGELSERVLSCRPAETETALPFSALGDLLEPVLDEALPLLPEPQRIALEVALLRTAPPASPTDRFAVSQAVLSIVRDQGPSSTVIAVDDLQWLDAPSQEVLEFVVRRLGDVPVRLLLARRGGPETTLPLRLDRGLERIAVGPLSVDELDRLIVLHLDTHFPRPRLVELHRTSRGNPYYAIEIVRAVALRGDRLEAADAMPIPESIGALLRRRLEALSKDAKDVLLLAAASPQPTALGLAAIARSPEGLDEALAAGILARDGRRVRFTHPLLASVTYDSAPLPVAAMPIAASQQRRPTGWSERAIFPSRRTTPTRR